MSSLLYLFIDCTSLYILNFNLIVLSLLTDSVMEGYSPRPSYTYLLLRASHPGATSRSVCGTNISYYRSNFNFISSYGNYYSCPQLNNHFELQLLSRNSSQSGCIEQQQKQKYFQFGIYFMMAFRQIVEYWWLFISVHSGC